MLENIVDQAVNSALFKRIKLKVNNNLLLETDLLFNPFCLKNI